MNPIAKLAGFAAVLALVFAGAAFAGSRLDVHPGRPAADKPAHMGGMAAGTMPVRGLAVSDHGLTLQLARRTAQPGRRFELAFRIADRRGRTVRDFDVEHTKRMHLIVVRRDMTGFQHLHPTQRPDGSWAVPAILPVAGSYRVFADFSVGEKPYTLADDLTVDGPMRSQALPAATTSVDVDGSHAIGGPNGRGRSETIAFSGATGGQFQLNIMMPVMGQTSLESVSILAGGVKAFNDFCAKGLEANEELEEGIGLSNTRSRLEQIYGLDHDFNLENGPDGGLLVTLRIPFRT